MDVHGKVRITGLAQSRLGSILYTMFVFEQNAQTLLPTLATRSTKLSI